MNTRFNKTIVRSLGVLLLMAATTSCSDDALNLQELMQPSISNGAATVSGLTFNWDKVENATQYAYELRDSDGNLVKGDVTTDTSVTFSGLADNSTYTLDVWAYAKVNSTEYKRSKIATLTGTTHAIVKLAAPAPTAQVEGSTVTITWNAIDNATVYKYSYESNGESFSGTTTETTLVLRALPMGDYTFKVTADNPDEAFAPSDEGTCTFVRSRMEKWQCKGTYTSVELNNSWDATIVAYDDNSYTIKGWYGVDGFDLDFVVDSSDNSILVTNAFSVSYGYYYVYTGLTDLTYTGLYTATYDGSNYSKFSGDATGGSVWFYAENTYPNGGYDQFVWENSGPSIDDLVGDYSALAQGSYYGWDDDGNGNWYDLDYTHDVSISKVDDTTINVANLYWSGYTLVGTVDVANKTITFAPQEWGYYTFAGDDGEDASVVATYDDNLTITMNGWNAWYGGYTYLYGITCTMTKK